MRYLTTMFWNYCKRCDKQVPKPEIYCENCKHFLRLSLG